MKKCNFQRKEKIKASYKSEGTDAEPTISTLLTILLSRSATSQSKVSEAIKTVTLHYS